MEPVYLGAAETIVQRVLVSKFWVNNWSYNDALVQLRMGAAKTANMRFPGCRQCSDVIFESDFLIKYRQIHHTIRQFLLAYECTVWTVCQHQMTEYLFHVWRQQVSGTLVHMFNYLFSALAATSNPVNTKWPAVPLSSVHVGGWL